MKALYNQEEFELPEYAVQGLKDFLRGVCEGMSALDDEDGDCWTWGRAEINDICNVRSVQFCWGGDDFPADDDLGDFAVISTAQTKQKKHD